MTQRIGILYLVSGPSGSGKTTLCKRLSEAGECVYATSCTTRPPRPGEEDGTDYFFLSSSEFQQKIQRNELLEYAEVHGNYYGTLYSEVLEKIRQGTDVVMDIDVQGAAQVRASGDPIIEQALVDLFVMPPDEAELLRRLTGRGTDSEEVIQERMRNSLDEMKHWPLYTYRILSASMDDDYKSFEALLYAERLRIARIKALSV